MINVKQDSDEIMFVDDQFGSSIMYVILANNI